jgi:hypothetical protein
VRDESTLPPEILLLGARQSQEAKCFALGPSGEVVAALGDELKREVGAEAVDLGQVLAQADAFCCYVS